MKKPRSGGGWRAIAYTFKKANQSGWMKMWRSLRSKNACKTCAVGMGGQRGGMVNEAGSFPEFCKKSLQAIAADLQGGIKPSFWSTYSVAQLQKMSPRDLEHCGRLTQPVRLREGASYYEPISWDEALESITARLKATDPDQSFWYFSGRSSNEAGFLLQLFARLYGTNHINNCSYYCHQASGVGLQTSLGTGTATLQLEDLEHADLVFVIGGNPASNHPRLMSSLMQVRRRGGKVVVINPVVELGLVNFRIPSSPTSLLFGTKIATDYVQPHIGGDLALLAGIAKAVVQQGNADHAFLKSHCRDSQPWLDHLDGLNWNEIESKSGVDRTTIERLAETYGQAKRVVFSWTMGITHHTYGVENVQAIANLALLRGMVGRPHCGLLPIRGHSNVQGIGSVGVTPQLKQAIFDALQQKFGLPLPTTPGLDTLGCMEQAAADGTRFALCLGGNLYGSNPDAQFAAKALSKIDQLVYLNTTLNTGHAHGLGKETIILPVLARDEEPQATTQESMFNYVRLSDGGPQRLEGPRSEVDVIASIAQSVLTDTTPIDWLSLQNTGNIRAMIARVIPGYEALDTIAETKKEFQIPGRTFHQPEFATDDGKARLFCHQLPDLKQSPGQLRLMTVRSEGQFNTVVYEEEDLYRGQERRDIILMHPSDLKQLGLQHDQPVTIESETGSMTNILARGYSDIRPGNALMYYPEANVLVPRQSDPASRTPAFKNVLVHIRQTTTA